MMKFNFRSLKLSFATEKYITFVTFAITISAMLAFYLRLIKDLFTQLINQKKLLTKSSVNCCKEQKPHVKSVFSTQNL